MGNYFQRADAAQYGVSGEAYAVIDTAQYDAYGNMMADIQTTNHDAALSRQESIGFGGQWGYFTDYNNITNSDIGAGTGLLCLGHRYYDTGTGRFLNRDPIGYEGGENLYAFCGGNPVNEIDPEGTTVSAIFDRANGRLVIWDDANPNDRIVIQDDPFSKDKAKLQAVFSGMGSGMINNPNYENNPNGPVQAGEYLISTLNPIGQQNMGNHFQLLRASQNWSYYGNRTLWQKATGAESSERHCINFHAGRISDGCVTVWSTIAKGKPNYPDSPTWENILALIARFGPAKVYTYTPQGTYVSGDVQGPGYNNPPGKYNGVMIVR